MAQPETGTLARLLKSSDVEVVALTGSNARTIGLLCAACGHADVGTYRSLRARRNDATPSSQRSRRHRQGRPEIPQIRI